MTERLSITVVPDFGAIATIFDENDQIISTAHTEEEAQ